jgi:hypothetical protein
MPYFFKLGEMKGGVYTKEKEGFICRERTSPTISVPPESKLGALLRHYRQPLAAA